MHDRKEIFNPAQETIVTDVEIVEENSLKFPQVPALAEQDKDNVVKALKERPAVIYTRGEF